MKAKIDIQAMTPQERLDLIDELWASLEPEDIRITDAQRQELHRRLDRYEQDGNPGEPWEVVIERIRKSLS